MRTPVPQNSANVPLVHWNHEVQALSADRTNHAFAEGIRLWRANGRSEDHQTHRLKRSVDTIRVDRVSIVDHKSVRLIARHDHAKLLRGPLCRRMLRDVPVQNATAANFEDDEYVQHAEGRRYDHEKISREHGSRVVPYERTPRRAGAQVRLAPAPPPRAPDEAENWTPNDPRQRDVAHRHDRHPPARRESRLSARGDRQF